MRKKLLTFGITLVTAVSSMGALLPSAAQASWTVNNQHQLVPMYVYPFWWVSGNDWYRLCDSMNNTNIGSTAIMDPDNGPGSSYNSDYDHVIDRCHADGNNVIGYVDTNYGAVPLATVEATIDHYYSWYTNHTGGLQAQIDGIFVDRMNNFPSTTVDGGLTAGEYYRDIFTYIKSKDSTHTYDDVVGNPGAPASTDWQLDDTGTSPTQVADEVVVFEGPETGTYGLGSYTKPSWVSNYPASDIAMLTYATPDADLATVCSTLKTNHAGLVDATNYDVTSYSTPWNYLQSTSYWTDFTSNC